MGAQNVLKAVVMFHYTLRQDEGKTMELFASLCEEHGIGYWTKDKETNKWMIDFHSFSYETCKFVLEYVFKHERQNILDMGDDIIILCGRGYHRDKYSTNRNPNERGLMHFVQHEMAQWSPPIRSQRCQHNYALLQLVKEDVIEYFDAHKMLNDDRCYDSAKIEKLLDNSDRKRASTGYLNPEQR